MTIHELLRGIEFPQYLLAQIIIAFIEFKTAFIYVELIITYPLYV